MTARRWRVRAVGRIVFAGPAGIALCVTAVTMLLGATTAEAAGRPVTFRAADGRSVNALIFEAGQRPAPAVVLVPMLGRGRDDWQVVGDRLADANITALAIDLPGLGFPGDQQSLAAWHADVVAAVTFLVSRPDVRPSSIGVAGASLGASLAALAGAADARIRSLALVSPSLDYRGVRIDVNLMRKIGDRPVWLAASTEDPYALRTIKELMSGGGAYEQRLSGARAHGTGLLTADQDLARALVDWLRQTLIF